MRLLVVPALLLAFAIAACGDDDGVTPSPTASTTPSATSVVSPTATPAQSPGNTSRNQLSFLIDRELYLVNSDGTGTTRLGEDGLCSRFSRLTWSPDGSRLVCDGSGSTVLISSDGTAVAQWADAAVTSVQWSPTGQAFLVQADERLIVRDRDGGALAELGPTDLQPGGISVAGRSRSWSPDGKQIVYWNSATSELRVYSLDSGSERTVAGDYRPVAWLSDGNTIVAAAGYAPPVDLQVTLYDIVLVDVATGVTSPVPELAATLDGPIRPNLQLWFAPDTSRAAVLTSRADGLPGLGVFDMQTRALTTIADSIISYPSDHIPQDNVQWSRDGQMVYWIDMGGPAGVYRAAADGTGLTKLTGFPLTGALSPDLRSVVYVEYAADFSSGALVVAEVDGANPRRIDSRPRDDGAVPNYRFAWRPAP